MRVQEQVRDFQHQMAGWGNGERPNEPRTAVGRDRPYIGPFLQDVTQVVTRMGQLEDKVSHLAHDGVLQRVLVVESRASRERLGVSRALRPVARWE